MYLLYLVLERDVRTRSSSGGLHARGVPVPRDTVVASSLLLANLFTDRRLLVAHTEDIRTTFRELQDFKKIKVIKKIKSLFV